MVSERAPSLIQRSGGIAPRVGGVPCNSSSADELRVARSRDRHCKSTLEDLTAGDDDATLKLLLAEQQQHEERLYLAREKRLAALLLEEKQQQEILNSKRQQLLAEENAVALALQQHRQLGAGAPTSTQFPQIVQLRQVEDGRRLDLERTRQALLSGGTIVHGLGGPAAAPASARSNLLAAIARQQAARGAVFVEQPTARNASRGNNILLNSLLANPQPQTTSSAAFTEAAARARGWM